MGFHSTRDDQELGPQCLGESCVSGQGRCFCYESLFLYIGLIKGDAPLWNDPLWFLCSPVLRCFRLNPVERVARTEFLTTLKKTTPFGKDYPISTDGSQIRLSGHPTAERIANTWGIHRGLLPMGSSPLVLVPKLWWNYAEVGCCIWLCKVFLGCWEASNKPSGTFHRISCRAIGNSSRSEGITGVFHQFDGPVKVGLRSDLVGTLQARLQDGVFSRWCGSSSHYCKELKYNNYRGDQWLVPYWQKPMKRMFCRLDPWSACQGGLEDPQGRSRGKQAPTPFQGTSPGCFFVFWKLREVDKRRSFRDHKKPMMTMRE